MDHADFLADFRLRLIRIILTHEDPGVRGSRFAHERQEVELRAAYYAVGGAFFLHLPEIDEDTGRQEDPYDDPVVDLPEDLEADINALIDEFRGPLSAHTRLGLQAEWQTAQSSLALGPGIEF